MPGHFSGELVVSTIPGRSRVRRLVADLVFVSALGPVITVPAGFECDGASVPRIALPLVAPWDKGARAAWLHDWLYEQRQDRGRADRLFLEAMEADRVVRWRRLLVFATVRVFGWFYWNGLLTAD